MILRVHCGVTSNGEDPEAGLECFIPGGCPGGLVAGDYAYLGKQV
jgi:hypothetical protein